MADQYYIEQDYFDGKYFGVIFDAVILTNPYIEEGYYDGDYYVPAGGQASLTAELTQVVGETVTATGSFSSQATVSITATRIKEFSCDFGALFTPSIIAVAQLAGDALLETIFAMTSTASVNRATGISLSTQADLNAQAAIIAVIDTNMTAQAQLVSDVYRVEFFPASTITANSNIYASRYTGTGRPRHTTIDSSRFSTTRKFGTHGLGAPTTGFNVTIPGNIIPAVDKDFVIEFWYYRNRSFVDTHILFGAATVGFIRIYILTSNRIRLEIDKDGGDYTIDSSASTTIAENTWTHIAVSYDGTYVSAYLNGTRVIYQDVSPATGQWLQTTSSRFSLSRFEYVDEARMLVGTDNGYTGSSITIPTAPFVNSEQTSFLYHFDNDGLDDISTTQLAQISMTSAMQLSASANPSTKLVSATLTNTAEISASVGKIVFTASDFINQATTTISADRLRTSASTLASTTTLTTIIGSIKEFEIDAGALFTPTVDADVTLAGVALLETAVTQTATAVKTTDVDSQQSAQATVSAQGTVTAGLSGDITSTATVLADVERIRTTDATLASQATQSTTNIRIRFADSQLDTTASITANNDTLRLAEAALSSAVTQTTATDRIRDLSSAMANAVTVTATATRIQNTDASLASSASTTATAVKITDIISTQSVTTLMGTFAVKTVDATPQLDSIATQLTVAFINATGTVLLESVATMTVAPTRIMELEIEPPIVGIELGSAWLQYIDRNTGPLPYQEDEFLISFWAYSPSGTILSMDPTSVVDYQNEITVSGNQLIYTGWRPGTNSTGYTDTRTITFSGINTTGWHHYVLYQAQEISDYTSSTTNVRLWVDNQEISSSVAVYEDGSSPTQVATDRINLWFSELQQDELMWLIGANITGYSFTFNHIYGANLATGGFKQLVAYWGDDTPDYTDSAVRAKLYDTVPQDLGLDGTATGLSQPNIYIPMDDYIDIAQLGSIKDSETQDTLEWREIDQIINLSNPRLYSTKTYDLSANDLFSRGLTGIFRMPTAILTGLQTFQAVMSASAALTNIISKTTGYSAALTATASLTTDISTTRLVSADLTATASLACQVSKITGYSATLTAIADLDAESGFVRVAYADMPAVAELLVGIDVIPPTRAEANLLATVTMTALVETFTDATALQVVFGELTCEATVIPPIRIDAVLSSEFTLSAIIGSIEQFAVLTVSTGTLSAEPYRTRPYQADLTVIGIATTDTTFSKFTGIIAQLPAIASTLTVGDVINIDPCRTITVEQETRTIRILPETRIITVEQETRINIIKCEERR